MLTTESSGQPVWSLQEGTVLMRRSLGQQLVEQSGDGMWLGEERIQRIFTNLWDDCGLNHRRTSVDTAGNQWEHFHDCVCVCVCVYACMLSHHQLSLTLCDPMDYSLPGSSVHGILQARILEWLSFPSPGDLPQPQIKPGLLHCRQILYHLSHQGNSPFMIIRR